MRFGVDFTPRLATSDHLWELPQFAQRASAQCTGALIPATGYVMEYTPREGTQRSWRFLAQVLRGIPCRARGADREDLHPINCTFIGWSASPAPSIRPTHTHT